MGEDASTNTNQQNTSVPAVVTDPSSAETETRQSEPLNTPGEHTPETAETIKAPVDPLSESVAASETPIEPTPTVQPTEPAMQPEVMVETLPPETIQATPSEASSSGTPPTDAMAVQEQVRTVEPTSALVEIKEKIVERVRDLNEAEKEQMFKEKLKTLSPKGVSARRGKRQKNLDAIVVHLRQHGYIANNEVEKLCKVSDATAERYLSALETQGLIMKLGRPGRGLRYRLREAI